MVRLTKRLLRRWSGQPHRSLAARLGPGEQRSKAGPQLQQLLLPALLVSIFLVLFLALLPGRDGLRLQPGPARRKRGFSQRRRLWGGEELTAAFAFHTSPAQSQVPRSGQTGPSRIQTGIGRGVKGSGRVALASGWDPSRSGSVKKRSEE